MSVADTGYETASVTHIITANANIANAAFAIIGKPEGVGNSKIPISKSKTYNNPYRFITLVTLSVLILIL